MVATIFLAMASRINDRSPFIVAFLAKKSGGALALGRFVLVVDHGPVRLRLVGASRHGEDGAVWLVEVQKKTSRPLCACNCELTMTERWILASVCLVATARCLRNGKRHEKFS